MTIYKSPFPDLPPLPTGNALINYFQSPTRQHSKAMYIDGLNGEEISAREGELVSYKFATVLREKYGIQKGDVVLLFIVNSIYTSAIHFGALTLGATISPANIVYNGEELAHQVRMVKPKLIIGLDSNMGVISESLQLANHAAQTVPLGNIKAQIRALMRDADAPMTSPVHVDGPNHPAYYCFSSGTSGLPKCVVTTHQNMISQVHQQAVSRPAIYTDIDITAAVLPMSHIYGLCTFLWVLPYCGATTVVYPRFEFETLLQGIVRYKICNLNVVPPILLLLAKSPLVDKYPEVKGLLKQVKSGAAPISRSTAELVRQRFGDVDIVNGYGMTEMSPGSHTKGHDTLKQYTLGSVGWLCPSTEMRLVDPETGRDAPLNGPGEIWIRGPQVMKEYLNNPVANAETFVGRWLRTGDIGEIREHNQMWIVDRIKELIKSKGHQVAPAELEGVLLTHPQVLDCAVIGVLDPDGVTEMPRAFVQTKEGSSLVEIANWFNSQVSRHKQLWGGISAVDAVPKNNSGKILRRLLREKKDYEVVYAQERERARL